MRKKIKLKPTRSYVFTTNVGTFKTYANSSQNKKKLTPSKMKIFPFDVVTLRKYRRPDAARHNNITARNLDENYC